MADPTISITDLRVDGQAAVFTVEFTGAPELEAESYLRIYDASTQLKREDELYRAPLRDVHQHSGSWDLPADELDDGDFTAWVEAYLWERDADGGRAVASERKGVSFLVGRGRVYPSTEAAPAIDAQNVLMIENVRLEGTWVIFDLVNRAAHDVSVEHSILFGRPAEDGNNFQEMKGREVVNGKATQSAHYLLPEALPDGAYTVYANSRIDGALGEYTAGLDFEARGGTLTVVPET